MKPSLATALLFVVTLLARVEAATNPPPYYTVHFINYVEEYYRPQAGMLNDRDEVASLIATNDDYSGTHLLIIGERTTNQIPFSYPGLDFEAAYVTSFNIQREALIDSGYDALLYRDGTLTHLSNLVSGTFFTPAQLNNRGVIAGGAVAAEGGPSFAFRHYRGRQKTFPTLVPHSHALATAINNRGRIVGGAQVVSNALDAYEFYHAVIFRSGRPLDLGTLPGDTFSLATGVNNRGEVIGHSALNGFSSRRAFLYRAGQMQEVPPLPGDFRMELVGINDRGQILGNSFGGDEEFPEAQGVIRIKNVTYRLADCVPAHVAELGIKAVAINAQGVILVTTEEGPALLTPATRPPPEPE